MALRLMADSLIFTTIQVVWVTRNGETPVTTKQMQPTAGDTQVYSLDMELELEPLSQGDTVTCRATNTIGQAESSVIVKLEQGEASKQAELQVAQFDDQEAYFEDYDESYNEDFMTVTTDSNTIVEKGNIGVILLLLECEV